MNAGGSGKQAAEPASKQARWSASSAAHSRKMSANAVPKMTTVPATLPRIVSPRRQSGVAISIPIGSGAATIAAIHRQLRSFIAGGTLRHNVAMPKPFLILALAAWAAVAQAQTPAAPPTPTDVKPGSINCEECPYPYPSSYLPLTLYGQDVRIAYMDVAPSAAANGHTVVLLHGNNFAGFYFGGPIDGLRKEGFRVIVPDQSGHRPSSKPNLPANLPRQGAHPARDPAAPEYPARDGRRPFD